MDELSSEQVRSAITAGVQNLARCQSDDGSWHHAYNGPAFLLPMYVALRHVSQAPLPDHQANRMREHLISLIGPDGGIGMYDGGPPTVFTSSLGYVALRMLGEKPDTAHLVRLRTWIHAYGTPLHSASWGKIFLSALGLYDYRGLHPMSPETWLLPRWAPVHPARLWCHARQVYLPMAWLYGRRQAPPIDTLLRALREELYTTAYDRIDWHAHRSSVASCDNYRPLTPAYRTLSALLRGWERVVPRRLRHQALTRIEDHMRYEDNATDGLRIGPVNAILNTLVNHFREPGGPTQRHDLDRVDEYLWDHDNTLDMQAYNSSQLWDTAFCAQALAAADHATDDGLGRDVLRSALGFVDEQQIRQELPDRSRFHRDPARGGWPFSTLRHGWPISDCTAEALTALHRGAELGLDPLAQDRRDEAVQLLLGWQNPDGGWPTYERIRGRRWLERLNTSQIFGDIMIDYSHVECTASCLVALQAVKRSGGSHWPAGALDRAMTAGRDFLLRHQRADGSFEGDWGICFTYGTWFAVRGLLACGLPPTHPAVRDACAFLLTIQHADGGWGESPLSCTERRHIPSATGQAVMTAWAVLTLTDAGLADHPGCRRGVRFLLENQHPDGSYPSQGFTGVFNRTSMINYGGYRHYFTLWALATWQAAAGETAAARDREAAIETRQD